MASAACCVPATPCNKPDNDYGRVEKWQLLDVYVSGSSSSDAAVLLVSDVFGYEAPLLRKLADKVMKAGYFVIVPDYLHGDSFKPGITVREEWRKNHPPEKAFEEFLVVIEVLKGKGISSIGAAGFCWGAKVVADLAKGNNLKAGVLLHPSNVTVEDIKDVQVPIAVLGAEIDKISPPDLLEEFKKTLTNKSEIDSFVTIYPGVAHGWAVRYDENDEVAVKHAEDAQSKMLEWFDKYLK